MGNCKVERAKLSPGFLPMGMKEYGGIIYIASYNPDTQECEIGSFPSPERDITGSNKIERQTGLQDGIFVDEEYSIPTTKGSDGFTPDLVSSKIQKLNEESILMLNPGDKFITTYEVKATDPSGGQEVVTKANFFDFFNDDTDKKLFNISFYRIDSGNNIVKILNSEVKTIQYREAIEEDEYVYYTQSSSGSIAVGIELNTLPYFSAAVRETSKLRDVNKTIKIEAVGESDSSVNFKGIRVDLTKNNLEKKSFHVENQKILDKVAVNVEDFSQDDEVSCEITPYCDYGYLSNLSQLFNLKMGKGISGDQINNIFKWKTLLSNNRIEIDFDFLLETENAFKMFVEFYDPWSNVSTVRNIPSPSIYGPMRLVMNLDTNEKTKIFDPYPASGAINPANQKGGIPFSKLIVSESEIMIPTLIDPTKSENRLLVRSDNALRKNHFYIVRICGYEEEVNDSGTITRIYHDAYRALYTNEAYNKLYDEQASLSPDSTFFRPIFSDEPYPLESMKYVLEKEGNSKLNFAISEVDAIPTPEQLPQTMIANGKYYPFSIETAPTGDDIVLNTKYIGEQDYSVKLLKPDVFTYGELKPNLLRVKTSDQDIVIPKANIQDQPQLNTAEDIGMNTTATLNIPDLNGVANRYNLKLSVNTDRPVYGRFRKLNVQGKLTRVQLSKLYHGDATTNHTVSNCENRAVPGSFYLYRKQQGKTGGDSRICNWTKEGIDLCLAPNYGDPTSSDFVIASVGKGQKDSTTKLATSHLKATGKHIFSVAVPTRIDNMADNASFLLIRQETDGTMVAFDISKGNNGNYMSTSDVYNFLEYFYYWVKDETISSQRYYVINNNLGYYSINDTTSISNVKIDILSGWEDVSAKTYTFNAYFKALDGDAEFNTGNVNTLIDSAKARGIGHNVVEGAENIKDANRFIPFVLPTDNIEDSTFTLQLSDELIGLTADPDVFDFLSKSEEAFNNFKIPDEDLSIKHIETSVIGQNYQDFCKYLKYDPTQNSLVIDWTASSYIALTAVNYDSKTTTSKFVDKFQNYVIRRGL